MFLNDYVIRWLFHGAASTVQDTYQQDMRMLMNFELYRRWELSPF